jgi:hypothetical protein
VRTHSPPGFGSKLILAGLSTLVAVSAVEIVCRAFDVDLEPQPKTLAAVPTFYRKPTIPFGAGPFLRRPGPDAWTGNVLRAGMRASGILDEAYADAGTLTVTYDRQGFRNPETLTDWDVAIVGDSFTELGYLPYDQLPTTWIGRLTGMHVKNLGVSYTGPLSYVALLKEYGRAASTKVAVMSFFEGNDLDDLQREERFVRAFAEHGRRNRNPYKQTSFVMATYHFFKHALAAKRTVRNADFITPSGASVPVSVSYAPPGRAEMSPAQVAGLDRALASWAETARSMGMTPWLAYMPCKRRVLDGYLRFTKTASAQMVAWHPSDLPDLVREQCRAHGIRFIDATPALRGATEAGTLTYNPIWDTHVNRRGAEIVATEIASALEGTSVIAATGGGDVGSRAR